MTNCANSHVSLYSKLNMMSVHVRFKYNTIGIDSRRLDTHFNNNFRLTVRLDAHAIHLIVNQTKKSVLALNTQGTKKGSVLIKFDGEFEINLNHHLF